MGEAEVTRPKVIIDLRWVRSERIDGIGRYTLGLSRATLKEDLDLTFLYHQEKLVPILKKELGKDIKLVRVPYDILSLSDLTRLPAFLSGLDPDVYLTPHYITSPLHGNYKRRFAGSDRKGGGYKVISIVHDLIPFLFPKHLASASGKLKLFYKSKVFSSVMLRRADRVVANSQATKVDLMKMFSIPGEKIKVLYPGVDFMKKVARGVGKYILYLGRMEPYKNIETILEAYAALPLDLKEKYPLVVAGAQKEPYYSDLVQKTLFLNIKDYVDFRGFVSETDLPKLYAEAKVFVYPSLYEGFGLPVIEARLAGLPVITSNTSSLPEAGGEGAVLVDPGDAGELSEAMRKVLTSEYLTQELTSYNKNLSKEFSWIRSAKTLRDIIYEITS